MAVDGTEKGGVRRLRVSEGLDRRPKSQGSS